MRQVGAASNGDRIREPNGGPMLPEELRPAPGECVYSRLIIPKAGEVLCGATVGEDIEEAQELPVDPAHDQINSRLKRWFFTSQPGPGLMVLSFFINPIGETSAGSKDPRQALPQHPSVEP